MQNNLCKIINIFSQSINYIKIISKVFKIFKNRIFLIVVTRFSIIINSKSLTLYLNKVINK